MRRSMLLAMRLGMLWALLLAGACSDDGGDDGGDVDAAPEIDALPGQAVTIDFAARVGTQDAVCGASTPYEVGTASTPVTFNDIRFYVSNIRLLSGADEVPMTLVQDGVWQYEDVALLDFENGTAGCASGSAETNSRVIGSVPEGTYDGIVFDLGVPFDLNHADLTTLPSPLNVAAMYWAWQLGHKFLRLDIAVQGAAAGWDVHLGSALCDSAGPTTPPDSECDRVNRPSIRLTGFDPSSDTVVLDLAALLADSDLSADAGGSAGCQSFVDDEGDCTPLFPNLGIDFATGDCVDDCQGQSAFRVE